jgi:type II secretory pathway pseudopilin PulG
MTRPASKKNHIGRWRLRGISLSECAMVAAVVAALAGALVNRLLFYQEEAELVAVQQTVGILRSALQMRAAKAYLDRRDSGMLALTSENPIDWLVARPANYLGEYYSPDIKDLQEGNWYFDRNDRTLVYLLQNGESFAHRTSILLKFKVRLFSFSNGAVDSPRPPGFPASVTGVAFDQVVDQAAVTSAQQR